MSFSIDDVKTISKITRAELGKYTGQGVYPILENGSVGPRCYIGQDENVYASAAKVLFNGSVFELVD